MATPSPSRAWQPSHNEKASGVVMPAKLSLTVAYTRCLFASAYIPAVTYMIRVHEEQSTILFPTPLNLPNSRDIREKLSFVRFNRDPAAFAASAVFKSCLCRPIRPTPPAGPSLRCRRSWRCLGSHPSEYQSKRRGQGWPQAPGPSCCSPTLPQLASGAEAVRRELLTAGSWPSHWKVSLGSTLPGSQISPEWC